MKRLYERVLGSIALLKWYYQSYGPVCLEVFRLAFVDETIPSLPSNKQNQSYVYTYSNSPATTPTSTAAPNYKPNKPISALPRWGCPKCGLRPDRQSRTCWRCGARMAYSTTYALKQKEAAYLSASSWWERY